MKKAIIVTAVLFIVSSLLVIISGAILGVSGISQLVGYLRQDDSTELRQGIGELADRIADGAQAVGDKVREGADTAIETAELFGDLDLSLTDNPDYIVGGDRAADLDVDGKDEIIIKADVANVVIVTTDGDKMIATLDLYSKDGDADLSAYSLLVNQEDADVYAKASDNVKDIVCKLEVEIPKAYNGKITVKNSVGTVDANSVSASGLDVSVETGRINLKSGSFDEVNASVDIGDIDVAGAFAVTKSLKAKVGTGNLKLTPVSDGEFGIDYNIDIGSVDYSALENKGLEIQTQSGKDGVSSAALKGHIKTAGYTDESPVYDISVGTGTVEFKAE